MFSANHRQFSARLPTHPQRLNPPVIQCRKNPFHRLIQSHATDCWELIPRGHRGFPVLNADARALSFQNKTQTVIREVHARRQFLLPHGVFNVMREVCKISNRRGHFRRDRARFLDIHVSGVRFDP